MGKFSRYIFEFILVTLSVIGAFLFEAWRVEREQETEYLELLKGFKEKLEIQRSYLSDIIDTVAADSNKWREGMILKQELRTSSILQLYERENDNEAMIATVIYFGRHGGNWNITLEIASQYDLIISNHFQRIRDESLRFHIGQYFGRLNHALRVNQRNIESFLEIQKRVFDDFIIDENSDYEDFYYGFDIRIDNLNSDVFSALINERNADTFKAKGFSYYNYLYDYNKGMKYSTSFIRNSIEIFDEIDSLIEIEFSHW